MFRRLLREWRAGSMADVFVRDDRNGRNDPDDLDGELDTLDREAAAGVRR